MDTARDDPRDGAGVSWAVLILIVIIVVLTGWHRRDAAPAADPIPPQRCRAWMADCLPGVGPKTRSRMAAAIRAGDLESLPPAAREVARRWFAF